MAFLKSPEFLNSTPFLNPGPAEGGTCRALLIFYVPIKKADLSTSTRCSHPHRLTPPEKSPLWEPLHPSYSLKSARSVQLWEIHESFQVILWAHCPFSPDHISILANGGRKDFAPSTASPGGEAPPPFWFILSFLQAYTELSHLGNTLSHMREMWSQETESGSK